MGLLDERFLQCESLLFHPMQSDFTTALAPDQLNSFLDQVAPSRYMYVDFSSKDKISLPVQSKAAASPEAKAEPKKNAAPKQKSKASPEMSPEAFPARDAVWFSPHYKT